MPAKIISFGQKPLKIGIFDSGIGGCQVLGNNLMQSLADWDIELSYFGDNAFFPYGNKKFEEVKERLANVIKFLHERKNIDILVIACITASSIIHDLINDIHRATDIEILDMVGMGSLSAVQSSKLKHIAIMGTQNTVASGSFQRTIKAYSNDIQLQALPAPEFVDLVQQGNERTEEGMRIIEKKLSLLSPDIDTIVLGCTHFSYLKELISYYLLDNYPKRKIKLIDPAAIATDWLRYKLARRKLQEGALVSSFYFTDKLNAPALYNIYQTIGTQPEIIYLKDFQSHITPWDEIVKNWKRWWKIRSF